MNLEKPAKNRLIPKLNQKKIRYVLPDFIRAKLGKAPSSH